MKTLQFGSIPLTQQAPSVPMQAGTLPAQTNGTSGINMGEMMNLMITMMIIVMMMKMMTGAMSGMTD